MEIVMLHQSNAPYHTYKSTSYTWGNLFLANDTNVMMCFATGKSYAPFLLSVLSEAISCHLGSYYYPEAEPFSAAGKPATMGLMAAPSKDLELLGPLQWNSGFVREYVDSMCVRYCESKVSYELLIER